MTPPPSLSLASIEGAGVGDDKLVAPCDAGVGDVVAIGGCKALFWVARQAIQATVRAATDNNSAASAAPKHGREGLKKIEDTRAAMRSRQSTAATAISAPPIGDRGRYSRSRSGAIWFLKARNSSIAIVHSAHEAR